MIDTLLHVLAPLPPFLVVMVIAMLPTIELQGAIPIAYTVFDLPLPMALFFALFGNMVMVPVLHLFLRYGSGALRRASPLFDRWFTHYIERARRKVQARYQRVGAIALSLFV